jgi:hypothetical protein
MAWRSLISNIIIAHISPSFYFTLLASNLIPQRFPGRRGRKREHAVAQSTRNEFALSARKIQRPHARVFKIGGDLNIGYNGFDVRRATSPLAANRRAIRVPAHAKVLGLARLLSAAGFWNG